MILIRSVGHGNNEVSIPRRTGAPPQYLADDRKTFDGGWYDTLGRCTKVFKRKGNAERWLAERPDVHGRVIIDPRTRPAEDRK